MTRRRTFIIAALTLLIAGHGVLAQPSCLPSPVFSGNVVLRMPPKPDQPGVPLNAASMTIGHFDSDASIDLIYGSQFGSLIYFHGRADWWDFDAPVVINLPFALPQPGQSRPISALAAADYDGDGNLDLAIGNVRTSTGPALQHLHIMLGNGNGTFQPGTAWGPVVAGTPGVLMMRGVRGLMPGDFDNDGNLDLICSFHRFNAPVAVLWGAGDGTFPTFDEIAPHQGPIGLAVEDIDGDGDSDAIVGHEIFEPLNAVIARSNGDRTFATEPLVLPRGFGHTFGDLNGDTWPDLVISSGTKGGNFGPVDPATNGGVDEALYVLVNDQTGHYPSAVRYATTSQPSHTATGSHPLLTDSNADGRDEIAVIRTGTWEASTDFRDQLLVFRNDGGGTFQQPPDLYHARGALGAFADNLKTLATADLNQDTYPDIFASGETRSTLLINDGNGDFLTNQGVAMGPVFPNQLTSGSAREYHVLAWGDLNNDERIDLVGVREDEAGPSSPEYLECTVMLQDEDGDFTTVISVPQPERYSTGMALADFDLDGNLDMAVSTQVVDPPNHTGGKSVRIAMGNGDGTFDPWVTYQTVGYNPRGVAAGDLNGDLYPDLVVPTRWGPNYPSSPDPRGVSVFLNNGDGTMASPIQYDTGDDNIDVAIADLNADGHPDIGVSFYRYVIVPSVNGAKILLNNGNGTFALGQTMMLRPEIDEAAVAWRIAFEDVNADDRPDMFVTCNLVFWEPTSGGISMALNNGDGTFQSGVDMDLGTDYRRPVFADFNGDGNVDFARYNGGDGILAGNIAVSLGNGDGTFGPRIEYGGAGHGLLVHDFNNDGAIDLGSPLGCSMDSDLANRVGFSILYNRNCDAPQPPCPADVNNDHTVNIDDLVAVITSWGACPLLPPPSPNPPGPGPGLGLGSGDMNCDNVVNPYDINPFMLAFTDINAYLNTYPNCDYFNGDMNNSDFPIDKTDLAIFCPLAGGVVSGGQCLIPGPCPADINGDRVVNIDDLVQLITSWGVCAK